MMSKIYFVLSLTLCALLLFQKCLTAANPDKPDFWVRNNSGTITHTWTGNDPDQALVMNMQGLKVVMQFQSSFTNFCPLEIFLKRIGVGRDAGSCGASSSVNLAAPK